MKTIIRLLCSNAFPRSTYTHQAIWFAVLIPFVLTACGKTESEGESEKVLVLTAQEFDAVLAAGEDDVVERGCVPGGPIITVEEPTENNVVPPVPVYIRFVPPAGSTIDLDTLRVKWGLIDVTSRVTENLEVSPGGVTGMIDAAKPGKYKFKVRVEDDQGRCGEARLEFRVMDEEA